MKITGWKMSYPVITFAALILAGCENEGQTKKIKELEQEVSERVLEIQSLSESLQKAETERDKYRGDCDQAQRDLGRAQSQLADAQRQLESARKAELALRESARTKAVQNPIEEIKNGIHEKFSAIWLIQGEQGNSSGIVAEADGKTWLYFPATALGGSAKLTVKDANGETITKFGEFQIAADANLARLEIKQEVKTRFVIDSKATLGETPRLLATTPPGDGGGPPKLNECQPGTVSASDLEFSSYSPTEANGFPVFNAETGALIALIVPSNRAPAGLWDAPQPSESGMSRAARLNRTIDWKPSSIGTFLTERRKIDELNKLSKILQAAASLTPSSTGLNLDASISEGTQSVRQIFEENKAMPAVQEFIKLNENLAAQRVRLSETDIRKQVTSVFGQLGNLNRRAATELKALKPSPCYKQETENALKWNDEAEKKLAATMAAAGR